jgi:transcriptional regulator GlxA family with amidase domain
MSDQPNANQRCHVGILIFEDVEVLDFCGPFEAFSVATALGESSDDAQLYDVHIIAERAEPVSCRNGLIVLPHYTIDDHPELDIVLVPGGRGTRRERTNQRVLDWLKVQDERVDLMTSVCTGAFLLAANGVLDGISATTHWGSTDWLRENHPAVSVKDDVRYVDEGRYITSAGVSAGIDMALHVIERMHGIETARQTARHMEYEWREHPGGIVSAPGDGQG